MTSLISSLSLSLRRLFSSYGRSSIIVHSLFIITTHLSFPPLFLLSDFSSSITASLSSHLPLSPFVFLPLPPLSHNSLSPLRLLPYCAEKLIAQINNPPFFFLPQLKPPWLAHSLTYHLSFSASICPSSQPETFLGGARFHQICGYGTSSIPPVCS